MSEAPIDPRLDSLQENGGPTPTQALLDDSPAFDAGDDAVLDAPDSLITDQRGSGFPRKASEHVDIGAFEARLCALNCRGDILSSTDSNRCGSVVDYSSPTITPGDFACGVVTCQPGSGSFFPLGVTTVTCKATDASNRTSQCSFNVIMSDLHPPVFSGCANVSANTAANACTAQVNYTQPTAIDNCDGQQQVSCSPPSGSTFSKGVTTVTGTASDIANPPNTGTCTFTVTVKDNTPPIITCPGNITQSAGTQCTAVVTYSATANDLCDGTLTPVCTPPSGNTFPKGTTTVTCTVKDLSDNSNLCSFTVTINDTTAPSITCSTNISLPAPSGQCEALVNYPAPLANDNCSGLGSPTCSPPSGSAFPKGVTTITCQVSDASGNSNQCSFTITVIDTQAPTIACPSNITTNTVNAGDASIAVNFSSPVATDNCSGVSVVCVPPSGSQFPRGTTTVNCKAIDTSNNQTVCTFTVKVFDQVIVDNLNGKILRFVSSTGEYEFLDCRKGTRLSGRGVVRMTSCKVELRDSGNDARRADRNVSGSVNTCTKAGSATVTYGGTTHTLSDSNMSNNTVGCP